MRNRRLKNESSGSLCALITAAALLFSVAVMAGEEKDKKADNAKPCITATKGCGGASVLKFETDGKSLPWLDLAVLIEDAKGGVRVADTIALPDGLSRAASLEKGTLIKTLQGQQVTTASELITQYDRLKAGDSVALSFEFGGKTGLIKFVKPKSAGNCVMMMKK